MSIKLENMSFDELRKLSLQKGQYGNASAKAREAQEEMQRRSFHFDNEDDYKVDSPDVKAYEDYDYSSDAYMYACEKTRRGNR